MAKTILNQKVDVTALYFTNKNGQLKSFPKRIEYDGGHHQFVESGLQMLVQTTSGVIRIFEMTDGHNNFHLRQNPQKDWTLVATY
ncbi:MAG TPA: hypothetical protein PLJ04_02555 [Candidatus Saccharibacteria bacterium]|nr:hypothetical protein [Candidatus Saccharibacteria bacterium]MCB9817113.1 hypothetical protein [Candidatus Nomurabacteria bacterium]HPD99099.1 hypothetical protein [Candidatus Saccharibacteria bacterium]HPR10440.1 hypothetical protein [Candidatus Saccharibacteria bacterium]